MKTLAIDTSLAAGSVAALAAGAVAEAPLPAGDHARLLVPALVEVAGRLGWAPRDAELVAVVRGPGSFTGLRVGVTTAKALAWAGGARLVGVSAFDVIARRTARALPSHDGPVAIAFDAGRGEVFAATAAPDPRAPTGWRVAPGSLAPAAAWLDGLAAGTCVAGPALAAPGVTIPAGLVAAPREAWFPHVAEVGAVGRLLAAADCLDDPAALVPDYLRPSYADEKRRP
ncbi:MAG: tRNA (adenosine(37)-N6)-threonylcarbamoyltransferase complex dimerization subunit type 1 TsaB [Planctomycetaceae bacterium]